MIAKTFLLLLTAVDAFVAPSHRASLPTSVALRAFPIDTNPFLLSDGLSAATYMGSVDGDLASSISGPLSALRTFFIVLTAAIFGITAIAYLTAAFLVPRAAEQLERDTKRLKPGLWEEYEAKLGDGETMANRPDLLQELGNIMQPIIVQDYEREAAMKFGDGQSQGVDSAANGSASTAKREGDVIDVTIKQTED